jgi:excisionase family DNA binding protein
MKTIAQFCEIFGITRPTFYAWLRKGLIKAIKIGGSVRITDEEIERLKRGE